MSMGWGNTSSDEAKPKAIVSPEVKRGIVVLLFGDGSSGKTYTAMSFPHPLIIIDTENRAINTKELCYPDKDIRIYEPIELKTEINFETDDIFDVHKTIENITRELISISSDVKSGKMRSGTVVIDSCTDLWSFIQEWGIIELSKHTNKDGSKKANVMMMRVNNQLDWKIMNKRNREIVGVLRSLVRYGINVVFTAREEIPPEYVVRTGAMSVKDKIRAHKDLAFDADVIFNLKRSGGKYLAVCEKLGGRKVPTEPIENLTYEKIAELKPISR